MASVPTPRANTKLCAATRAIARCGCYSNRFACATSARTLGHFAARVTHTGDGPIRVDTVVIISTVELDQLAARRTRRQTALSTKHGRSVDDVFPSYAGDDEGSGRAFV